MIGLNMKNIRLTILLTLLASSLAFGVTRLPNGNLEITQEEAVAYNQQVDQMQDEIDHWHTLAVQLNAALEKKNKERCI